MVIFYYFDHFLLIYSRNNISSSLYRPFRSLPIYYIFLNNESVALGKHKHQYKTNKLSTKHLFETKLVAEDGINAKYFYCKSFFFKKVILFNLLLNFKERRLFYNNI